MHISIPQPCHEDWKVMTPSAKGRFCNACSKVVIDFTRMNNEDIIRYLRQSSCDDICGRFKTSQVSQQPAEETQHSISQWHFITPLRKFAALLLTGMTLALSSCKHTTGEPAIDAIETDSSAKFKQDSILQHTEPDVKVKLSLRQTAPSLLLLKKAI